MAKLVSKQQLEEIRFRNDIVEVIGAHLTLQRAGGAFKALCPFHKEKTPSFHVNPQRQIFHCFGCGAGGDVFGFLMQHESVDFGTAVRMLAERAGIRLELEEGAPGDGDAKARQLKIHEGVAQFYRRCLQETAGAAHARRYLETRALSAEIVDQFLIGFAPDRWDALLQWGAKHQVPPADLETAGLIIRNDRPDARHSHFDRFRNRLMFPIRDEQGRVIGFSGRALDPEKQPAKYVNSPETPLFRKGRVLYAIDRARRAIADAGEAIVCEGQIDVIRCHAAGCVNAVAAQGTAFTEDHARIVKRYADSVVLVFDPDVAGQDAAVRAAGVFMQAGLAVRVATLPPKQDPDAFIRAQGADAFRAVLAAATSVVEFQIAVLQGREDARSDVGALRISRAVLQTIALSPNAVLRAKLIQDAAAKLGLPEQALTDDLRFQQARGRREPAGEAAAGAPAGPAAAAHPPEEVALCAYLSRAASEPETVDLVRRYLPLRLLQHPECRRVAEACLQAAESGTHLHSVLEAGGDVDPGLLRFAAVIQSEPAKVRGNERSAGDAMRDIVLKFWQREFRRRRDALDGEIQAQPAARDLQAQRKQYTLHLNALKTWDDGAPLIAMEMEEA